MFIQSITRDLQEYYFRNLVNLNTSKDLIRIMKSDYIKANNTTMFGFRHILDTITAHYSYVALELNLKLSSAENVFLIMVQDVYSFLEEQYTPHKKARIVVFQKLNDYQRDYNTFCMQAEPVLYKIMNDPIISNFFDNIANDQTYIYGEVIRLINGDIDNLEVIELRMYNMTSTKLKEKFEAYALTIESKCKIHIDVFDVAHITIGKRRFNVKFDIDLRQDVLYTIDQISINVSTMVVSDPFFAMSDLKNKIIRTTYAFDALSDPLLTQHYMGTLKDATNEQKVYLRKLYIKSQDVLKFFKYSKTYKSQKKIRKFMKDAFRLKVVKGKIQDYELLETLEYLI